MKRRVPFVFGAVAAVTVASLLSCSPAIPKYEFPYAEMRAKLPNGLKVVVMPDDSTPLVEVDIRYNTGSNQDPPGKAGIAHFAEHMMFQYRIFGEDKPPIFDVLPQITTFFNAFTAADATHYMLQGRKEELQTFIRLEAARMVGECRKLPPEEFEREREVVRNELRQNFGRPESEILRLLLNESYAEGHPYHHPGIGDDKQLANITQEDVCQFIDEYYVPQNATVIVAGNVDPDAVRNEVLFAFGEIKKGLGPDGKPRAVKKFPIEVPTFEYKKIVKELPVERPSVHVVWAIPPRYSKEGELAYSLNLAGGLVASFNEDWNFATSVSSTDQLGGHMAPLFIISMELKSMDKLDDALEFVWKATGQAHRPFESGEYTESKNRQIGSFVAGFEELGGMGGRTTRVGELVQFRENFDWDSTDTYIYNEFQRIRTADPGDARSFVKRTLKKSKAKVFVIKPNEDVTAFKKADLSFKPTTRADAIEPIIDPAEAKRPLVVPKEDSALVKARRFELGNGMKVVLLPQGSKMPVVSMNLVFNVGAAHEPEGKEGLASAAAEFLSHPRGSMIGMIGAWWGAYADDDTTTFTVQGINLYTKEMIVGLERKLKIGSYNQEGIESWQKYLRGQLDSRVSRQNRAFSRESAMAVWGPTHPYAVRGMATKSSIGRIGRDVCNSFRNKHYTAKNATLIVAGNFNEKVAEDAIREHFGGWDGGHKDDPITMPATAGAGVRAIGVIGDKLPQVSVAIQYPGPVGVDGQQAARLVLSTMMYLKMSEIRTELGSTYGIGARRETKLGPSRYIIRGGVQSERAGETLKVMREKLEELRTGVEFDGTFAKARRLVLKNLLAESTVSSTLAGRLATIAIYGQSPDYYDKLTRYVATLSPAQVRSLIATDLKPENEVIALMGDKEALEKTFAEAGIQDVKYIDVSE